MCSCSVAIHCPKNANANLGSLRQKRVGAGECLSRNQNERVYERSLIIFAARKHDDVGRRSFGSEGPVIGIFAVCSTLKEAKDVLGDTAKVALAVRRYNAEKALASLLGQIGLLEDALGRVYIGQVEGGSRVTGIEYGRQPHATSQRLDHDSVHLVIGDMTVLSEVDGVNDLVVAVGLVAVEVFCLSTMAYKGSLISSKSVGYRRTATDLNSGRIVSRGGGHPSLANAWLVICSAWSAGSWGFAGRQLE